MPCGVYLDIEEPEQLALDHDALLSIIRGWCVAIDGAGYTPGIYSSAGTLWTKVHPDELPIGCLAWVAKWSDTPPDLPCDLWQNSDHGSIPGYDGPVDTDEGRSDCFKALVELGSVPPEGKTPLVPDACPIDGVSLAELSSFLATPNFKSAFNKWKEGRA